MAIDLSEALDLVGVPGVAFVSMRSLGLKAPQITAGLEFVKGLTARRDKERGESFYNWIIEHHKFTSQEPPFDTYFFYDKDSTDCVGTASIVLDDRMVGYKRKKQGWWFGGVCMRKQDEANQQLLKGVVRHLLANVQRWIDFTEQRTILNACTRKPAFAEQLRAAGFEEIEGGLVFPADGKVHQYLRKRIEPSPAVVLKRAAGRLASADDFFENVLEELVNDEGFRDQVFAIYERLLDARLAMFVREMDYEKTLDCLAKFADLTPTNRQAAFRSVIEHANSLKGEASMRAIAEQVTGFLVRTAHHVRFPERDQKTSQRLRLTSPHGRPKLTWLLQGQSHSRTLAEPIELEKQCHKPSSRNSAKKD